MYEVNNSSIIQLDPILGLPPVGHISDDLKINSMPMAEIIPCEPRFRAGLSIFTLENAWSKYNSLLQYAGYTLKGKPLRLAFLADNFPTDSFSNEYGESFLQKMTDVASEGLASLSQFFGQRSATGLLKEAGTFLENQKGVIGKVGKAGVDVFKGLSDFGKETINHGGKIGEAVSKVGKTVDALLSGARVDFPSVWKNSAYTPSYTMTIRLYNPNPGSKEDTKKYIIGPIAALLLLGIPQSKNGSTYNWPFLHKVKAPGIYNLNPAFISNIAVIKGGDQQQIAFNERLAMVDVRIDFGSLYNSILASKGQVSGDNRPTLKKYLKAMEEEKLHTYDAKQLSKPPSVVGKGSNSWFQGVEEGKPTTSMEEFAAHWKSMRKKEKEKYLARYAHVRQMIDGGETVNPPSRVTTSQTNKYNGLYANMPGGLSD